MKFEDESTISTLNSIESSFEEEIPFQKDFTLSSFINDNGSSIISFDKNSNWSEEFIVSKSVQPFSLLSSDFEENELQECQLIDEEMIKEDDNLEFLFLLQQVDDLKSVEKFGISIENLMENYEMYNSEETRNEMDLKKSIKKRDSRIELEDDFFGN